MIPVHIWIPSNSIRAENFSETFYEFLGGRESIYGRPSVHKRWSRLTYQHVGEFANHIFTFRGKPSIHVFILTPIDLAPKLALPSVCRTIMDAAEICPGVITIFLDTNRVQGPPIQLTHVIQCHSTIQARALQTPKRTLCIRPGSLYERQSGNSDSHPLDFQDLANTINQVKIRDREIKIVRSKAKRDDINIPVGLD